LGKIGFLKEGSKEPRRQEILWEKSDFSRKEPRSQGAKKSDWSQEIRFFGKIGFLKEGAKEPRSQKIRFWGKIGFLKKPRNPIFWKGFFKEKNPIFGKNRIFQWKNITMEYLSIIWAILGLGIALLSLPGTLELLLLTLGGVLPSRRLPETEANQAPRHIGVVVPAHNEQASISPCVTNLLNCDKPSGKFSVYVVADNCTDDTAARAEAAGAQVLVRHDEQRRGKGYALDYAFNILLKQDIDAVLVVDADTVVEANFIRACEHVFANGADAVQCRYTVNNPQASLRTRLMHVAFLAFNVLRPRGRERWGLSVGISGNGFGLSRKTLQSVPYCARSVVEDLEYHLTLVRAGMRVRFIDATTVRADMPTGGTGTDSQRARWEGGRFRMMRELIPPLTQTVFRGRLRLLEPLLELLLLPLGWHVLLLLIALLIPFALTQGYALFGFGVVVLHVLAALWVGGGTIKDLAALASAPFYILWKLTQLPRLLKTAHKDATWIRTKR
jgi:cellulose synthase/poly-beta-1,6-N-acetylglucosamine synthase-like glycosyltransferase